MSMSRSEGHGLIDEVFRGSGKVAVYGVGYVGLSLVAVYLRKGLRVIGVDIDEGRLKAIREGRLWFNELEIKEALQKGLGEGRLELTADGVSASRDSLIKVITVPVDIDWFRREYSFNSLKAVSKDIGEGLKEGDLVILESSVPPGTTLGVVRPALEEASGLTAGEGFHLAYSPERVYVGRAVKDIEVNYPKVVGGVNRASLKLASEFYRRIVEKGVIEMSSTIAAEFEKLAEGVYRDVNIALANELALASMALGVDFYEVREAANSQPYSHIHLPGPGVGGYCIPLYPYFLMRPALSRGYVMRLTQLAREINEGMPYEVIRLAEGLRAKAGINPKKTKAAVLGAAFRGDIDDTRLSPTHDIVALLKARSYRKVIVHDPLVRKDEVLDDLGAELTDNLRKALKASELVIIATKHSAYRELGIKDIINYSGKEPIIIDAVNVIKKDTSYSKYLALGVGKQIR